MVNRPPLLVLARPICSRRIPRSGVIDCGTSRCSSPFGHKHPACFASTAFVKNRYLSHEGTFSRKGATRYSSRLDDLKAKLDAENGEVAVSSKDQLLGFASKNSKSGDGTANGDFGLDSAAKALARRRRNVLPKPKWLKAQPTTSENYQRLRSTVRDLGLATVSVANTFYLFSPWEVCLIFMPFKRC